MSLFPRMVELLPPSSIGTAEIQHFEMTKHDSELFRLRAILAWDPRKCCPPGNYARLVVDGVPMMTDVPEEQRTSMVAVRRAKGRVLIAGLGLGMILHPICRKRSVQSVLVVEKSHDVVSLVAKTIPAKARVIMGDIFTWSPGARVPKFDAIFFDIWPNAEEQYLPEMERLRDRFKRWLAPGGWMGAWKERDIRRKQKRDDKRDPLRHEVNCGGVKAD